LLPSSILNFFDLGGQRGIRSIWHRYYDDCHAVAYVIDAQDRERLSEGLEVFGTFTYLRSALSQLQTPHELLCVDSVLSSPQILNVPLLLLANKQDSPESLSATEIRHDYEEWDQRRRESARRRFGEDEDAEMERKRQRIASLDVMGVSALDG
jgi:ADP-ribosylation factor related protein 1